MRKTVAALLLILVLILATALSSALAEPLGFGYVNATDVALRRDMGGCIIGRLPKDTCVWIRDARTDRAGNKWYEINAAPAADGDGAGTENTGWMRAEFIDTGEALWHAVESVSASADGMIALRKDGTVVSAGKASAGEKDGHSARGWGEGIGGIRQVGLCEAGQVYYAVGRDGTYYDSSRGKENGGRIYTAGGKRRIWEISTDYRLLDRDNLLDWIYPKAIGPELLSHVVSLADSGSRLMLLTDDGRVYTAGWQKEERGEEAQEPDWEKWTDVVSLAAASCRFSENGEALSACAAVRKDGTVLAAPAALSALIGEWTNMVKIVIGEKWVLGLKQDGTVLTAGIDGETPPDVSAWSDIMDLDAGKDYCVGVRSSGSLVFAGDYRF